MNIYLNKLTGKYWLEQINNIKKNIEVDIMLHFITYGDHNFSTSKNRLLKEAHAFNEFKTITSYGPEDLSQEFKQKHKDILKCSRGGGYWIWRPYILKKKIDTVLEGDFVIYLDAGCTLNPKGKQKIS